NLRASWMNMQGGGQRPAWLDDPLLRDTYSPEHIEEYWGAPLAKMTPEQAARARRAFEADARSAMRLRAAGMRFAMGTDTGQSRFFIGYFNHIDVEALVAMGLTPSEAITA